MLRPQIVGEPLGVRFSHVGRARDALERRHAALGQRRNLGERTRRGSPARRQTRFFEEAPCQHLGAAGAAPRLGAVEAQVHGGAGDQLQLRGRDRPAPAQIERNLLRQAALEVGAPAKHGALERVCDPRLVQALEVQPHAAADAAADLVEPVEAPQIEVVDDQQDLQAAHALRLLQDADELLLARATVERSAEIVDDQERAAGASRPARPPHRADRPR